jgi:hypothetical protein
MRSSMPAHSESRMPTSCAVLVALVLDLTEPQAAGLGVNLPRLLQLALQNAGPLLVLALVLFSGRDGGQPSLLHFLAAARWP